MAASRFLLSLHVFSRVQKRAVCFQTILSLSWVFQGLCLCPPPSNPFPGSSRFFFNCLWNYSHSCFFSPCSPPHSLTLSPPRVNPHITVHIHGSCINVLQLITSPFFIQCAPSPLDTVTLIYTFMLLFLFCSLVYCVH